MAGTTRSGVAPASAPQTVPDSGAGSSEVTISAGVADERDGKGDPEATMGAADRALYAAKRNGRNRTIAAGKRRIPAA